MIDIANRRKADWIAIRNEYLAGGISQRALAEKYGLSDTTVMKKANKEGWNVLRKQTTAKATEKAQQKIANAMVSNADKLEKAKGLAIDRIIKALEGMPDNAASNVREYGSKDGKRQTVEYNLLELVTALEKMTKDNDKMSGDTVTVIIDV